MEREREIVKALNDLAAFLRRINLRAHAQDFEVLRDRLVREGLEAVASELTGVNLWGGAGSYADLYICRENFASLPADLDIEAANKEYQCLLFRLASVFREAGLSSYWLESRYEILREWCGSE
jgi:hypothetical protein